MEVGRAGDSFGQHDKANPEPETATSIVRHNCNRRQTVKNSKQQRRHWQRLAGGRNVHPGSSGHSRRPNPPCNGLCHRQPSRANPQERIVIKEIDCFVQKSLDKQIKRITGLLSSCWAKSGTRALLLRRPCSVLGAARTFA